MRKGIATIFQEPDNISRKFRKCRRGQTHDLLFCIVPFFLHSVPAEKIGQSCVVHSTANLTVMMVKSILAVRTRHIR
jgi:hypothetical protein